MNGRRLWIAYALPLGALALLAGCHHCGTQSCYQPAPVIRSAVVLPPPAAPCPTCPAPAAPLAPPAAVPPPADSGYQPMPPGPTQQAGGPASPPGVSLGVPVPALPERPRESARVGTPESPEPPKAPNVEMPREPEAPVKPRTAPSLPVGIANFAEPMPGVATGLRPMLDGIDWLKANEYKTALHVRAPGENDDGDRQLFEQKGLKYLSLEVSPKTLTPKVVEEFNRIVTDPANRPLFVYDKDGSLAGALWYLHFRTAGKLPDEEARKKAASLGLKEEADGGAREMWLAIQKFLEEQEKK
jgi:protein tyrosine phosphatase (PTP) superfamily phosphohydrolase (DUF442 family)